MASNEEFRKLVTEHIDTSAKEKESEEKPSKSIPLSSKTHVSSVNDQYFPSR
jgi:hypothetical protein